jgi:hypothetical protein
LLHHVRKEIVRLSGDGDLLPHVCLLDSGSIQREHLHVDTGGVHLGDAPAADILKLLENLLSAEAPTAE